MSATRPWVDAFADAMERKLALNRHKGDREGWQKKAGSQLTIMLRHEVAELCDAVERARPLDSGKPEGAAARLAVVNECADVANIAMMIADKVGEMLPSPEGREATFLRAAEAYCVAKHNFDVASAPGGWLCGPAHRYDPSHELRIMLQAYVILRAERAVGGRP